MFTTRNVEAGEELCIPYLDVFQTYKERTKTFSVWNSGSGFVCACERCRACREDRSLADIEAEVVAGHEEGMRMAMMTRMPYKAILDKAVPAGRRSVMKEGVSVEIGCLHSI